VVSVCLKTDGEKDLLRGILRAALGDQEAETRLRQPG